MNKIKILFAVMLAAVLFVGCKSDDNDSGTVTPSYEEVITLNVDVVLPASVRSQWQPSIDWALDNINKSQQKQSRLVKLNLRYHNEDTEDLDKLAYKLANPDEGDDTCHAIIGPYHSSHAKDILRYAGRNRLPVIMPTCTSSELQRTNARNTYAWFLTESDITQCEIMVTGVAKMTDVDVALVYSDDTYGQSFHDWFGYYATERQLHMAGDGIMAYENGTDLKPFLDGLAADCKNGRLVVCFALSDAASYKNATEQVRLWYNKIKNDGKKLELQVILSDTALDDQVIKGSGVFFNYGVSPTASSKYGFPQSYEARFGRALQFGEARIYDALTMLALGAAHQRVKGENCTVAGREVKYYDKPYGPTLTDHIRSIVASDNGLTCGWESEGLARAFSEIAAGRNIQLTGASGSLNFDNESYTKVLGTDYMFWRVEAGAAKPILHISTESSNTQASTTSLWELDKMWMPNYEDVAVHHNLPAVTDRWAVVISPSTTWSNYRHQADAFAMYQLLRKHGYDDDHIVLIVEDNLANDSRNVFPGQIFVERSNDPAAANDQFVNEDVRKGAKVDYKFSDLQITDIADIMMGRSSSRLPEVIHPTASSDVFFFWSGHGGNTEGPLWGNEDAEEDFGRDRIRNIVAEMSGQNGGPRMYRRMMFALETCFSGHWGNALTGQPDVLVLTAANAQEPSKADMHDRDLGVYLSNAFARTFRRQINANNDITIYNLFRELFKTTKGSHVSIYNQQEYGSVYSERMSEFLPQ